MGYPVQWDQAKYLEFPWSKEYVRLADGFGNMTVKNTDGSFASAPVLDQYTHQELVKRCGTSVCKTNTVIRSIQELSEKDYRDFMQE